ncbi:hypothetical protein C0991_009362 [Blastosporella zonata]|nr:hypothetical protein C0991_009362 [Blastosporella zonata]
MARLPFSILDRVEGVMGIIQSSFTTIPERLGHYRRGNMAPKDLPPWQSHRRPYIQRVAIQSRSRNRKRRIEDVDRDSLSSMEVSDDALTLGSEGASAPQSCLEFPSAPFSRYIVGAEILPNIADYDFETEDTASDTDTLYSYDAPQSGSLVGLEGSTLTVEWKSNDTQSAAPSTGKLIQFTTALSPPPLYHSGRTRSKVVSIPRDSPGTCP